MAAEAGGTEYPAAVSGSKKEAKRLAAKNALEKLKS
jgi:dsRNA-specific ribonuclease